MLLNVRVRGRIAGRTILSAPPAGSLKIDVRTSTLPVDFIGHRPEQCTTPGGVTRPFGGTARVYAVAHWRYPLSGKFEFTLPGEGSFLKVVTTTAQYAVLNWSVDPLGA